LSVGNQMLHVKVPNQQHGREHLGVTEQQIALLVFFGDHYDNVNFTVGRVVRKLKGAAFLELVAHVWPGVDMLHEQTIGRFGAIVLEIGRHLQETMDES